MIDAIIRFSIQQKLIIGLLVMGLVGWGVYSAQHLPIDAVPDITDNQVQVITTSPTLAAQEVEKFITYPLEMAMANIPGVVEIRSVSRFGLSVITVVFEEGVDVYLARQLISERIKVAESEIPQGMGDPGMGPITTGLGEVYQYVIHPAEGYEDQYSAMELRTIQDWIVRRQLSGVKGVIEVNSSGGFLKQYEVAVNPDKLNSMDVSLEELYNAIARNNANTGGSYIEKNHYTYFIRGEGLLESKAAIEMVPVKNVDGTPILVKDVAKVQFGHAPRFGAVTMNGQGEVVAGQVMMLKGENSAEVTQRVKERMEQIRESLPEGVVIEPYLDRTKLVNRTTRTVVTNLVEGGLIVVFVLVLLLGNLRAGLVVASVIPLSMLFALGMMNVFGVSANLMSLGAIDFGLIVDGAVIIVEAIVHRLQLKHPGQQLGQQQMDNAVLAASVRIRKSAAFGEVIILIVYLPILFLTGVEGKMFRPMAQTVSFAILGALILSLTYVPMMSALLLNRKISVKRTIADRIIHFLQRLYQPSLRLALKFRVLVLGATIILFIFSLWVFSRMGGEFIPTLEEGDFALHQILPPGSSIKEGVEVSAKLQRILLDNFPEVEKVVTKIGTAEIPTDIMPLEAGDIYVIMKPKDEWVSAGSREEMFEKMEAKMNQFPGVMYEFTQPIQMRFNELMTGVRQDIAIKIFGEDLGLLQKKAREAEAIISGIEGVGDIQVEPVSGLQQMAVHYERAKLAKYGLDVEVVNRTIRTSFAGERAGFIYEGERRFGLVLRLEEAYRDDISHLKNLYIPLPNGSQIPLQEVAHVHYEEGPAQISRDNTKRRIVIGVNARMRDVESLVNEIQLRLQEGLGLPPAYYVEYGGQFENLQRARSRLMLAVPVALALIFILLYLTFGSTLQALLIFTAIPLSAIGGIWALYLRDMPFSISAGVGFIALFGVAVLNGIVLIAQFNDLKEEGVENVLERIYKGTRIRLRPVIMTASVASLGFLPMATSTTAGAEVQQPLATVVIGGLITATFLTLVILPILYYYSEQRFRFRPGKAAAIIALLLAPALLPAQPIPVTLDEAMEVASRNYPLLKRDRQFIEQQRALINSAAARPNTNVFISGEEVNPGTAEGIHSLGFNQNFNWPGTKNRRESARQQQVLVGNAQLEMTKLGLRQNVARAYYQILYVREQQALARQRVELFTELVELAQLRFDLGETGKIPVLSAQGKQQEASLQQQQISQDYEIALTIFNNWMYSDTAYEVAGQRLPDPGGYLNWFVNSGHPLLLLQQQQLNLAEAQVEVQRNNLLPQIMTGGLLQMIDGDSPFFGYQMGLSIPLGQKAVRARIEGAEVQAEIRKTEMEAARLQLDNERRRLLSSLQKEQAALDYIRQEMLPLAQDQIDATRKAYSQGAVEYQDYLRNLEQALNTRQRYLEALQRYNLLKLELEFLSGRR